VAKQWIDDDDATRFLSKYIVNDKHYGMWAIQVQDNRHEFFVVTETGQVLGSKHCTLDGPTYTLFDDQEVNLAHVAPHLTYDGLGNGNITGHKEPEAEGGRIVRLKEFRLSILEYINNGGAAYCCSRMKSKISIDW
jgi:hypothetical protein